MPARGFRLLTAFSPTAALILARCSNEKPPELVAQSRFGFALQRGQAKEIGLVGRTSGTGIASFAIFEVYAHLLTKNCRRSDPLFRYGKKAKAPNRLSWVNSRQSEGTPIATGRRRSWPSVDCDDDGHPSANLGRGAHLLILRSSASYRWTDAFGRYRLQPPTDICRPAAVLQPTEWNTGSS
jgi:hypothetical protein